MSSTRSPQQPLAEATHLRILRAATAVFAERGYAATSVAQILDFAQVDLPTFEAHFNDTEDCFLQAYDSIVAEAAARIRASISDAAPWPERVAGGLATLIELIEANRGPARLVLVEAQCASAAAACCIPTLDRVAAFMREGRTLPSADPELPPLVDYAYPGGVAQMLATRLRERPDDPLADLFPETLHLLLLPYLGAEQTTAFLTTARRPGAR